MDDPAKALIEHIPGLRRYARALLSDPSAADDLVQDTLERAWSRIHLWEPTGSFRSWLMTIMHNVFANGARNHSKAPPLTDIAEVASALQSGADQEHTLIVRDLCRAVHALRHDHREVLLLVAMQGFSYRQAAEILNVPVGTVMSRLGRARSRLRDILRSEPAVQLRSVK